MSIVDCTFTLVPLHEQAQELTVQFSDGEENHSAKKFVFRQEFSSLESGEILDIYSQNGICSDAILQKLFENRDVKEAQKVVDGQNLGTIEKPKVVVLDLKGAEKHYFDETIPLCEQTVLEFFQEKSSQNANRHGKKMHAIFQKSKLDFMIHEGSLKSALLNKGGFSEGEISFLQESGKTRLCQFAEFFMNGFKLGLEVPDFPAQKYISSVSGAVFRPHEKSTVFYPPSYYRIYSLKGEFAQVMGSCFSISGTADPATRITTMSVEKKG